VERLGNVLIVEIIGYMFLILRGSAIQKLNIKFAKMQKRHKKKSTNNIQFRKST